MVIVEKFWEFFGQKKIFFDKNYYLPKSGNSVYFFIPDHVPDCIVCL